MAAQQDEKKEEPKLATAGEKNEESFRLTQSRDKKEVAGGWWDDGDPKFSNR